MSRNEALGGLVDEARLIAASAGTGKTYSIGSLYLRLIAEKGLKVEKILVVTFTEAATAELNERIRARLALGVSRFRRALAGASLEGTDDALDGIWERHDLAGREVCLRRFQLALASFDQAAISTIHGFCRRMLAENAFESGADFEQTLSQDASELYSELAQDFWTRRSHDAPMPLLSYALTRPRKVDLSTFAAIVKAVVKNPDVELIPPRAAPVPDDWYAQWLAACQHAQACWENEATDIVSMFLHTPIVKSDGRYKRPNGGRERTIAAIRRYFAAEDWEGVFPSEVSRFARNLVEANLGKNKVLPAAQFYDAVETLNTLLDAHLSHWMHDLAEWVPSALAEWRSRTNTLFFADLLRDLANALKVPERREPLVAAVRARFDAALIDEFQDTDPVQFGIFQEIFGEGCLLRYIGDPKQAIYSFRGADIEAYQRATLNVTSAPSLDRNWRSDAPLIEALNALYGVNPAHARSVPAPFMESWIPYEPIQAEKPQRVFGANMLGGQAPLQFRFVPREMTTISQGKISAPWRDNVLPRLVAGEIAHLLNSDTVVDHEDGKGPQPVRPSDVAVLVRSNKQAQQMQGALTELRVRSVIHSADSVFNTPEAEALEVLLTAVVDSSDRRAVRAALATHLMGVRSDELVALQDNERELEGHIADFRRWFELWTEHRFMRAFRALVSDKAVPERLLATARGERRMTNLLHLAEILHAAEADQRLPPDRLVRWFTDERRSRAGDDADARQLRLESDGDAVELITIHKSKGLEYGFVFCPYLNSGWSGGGDHPLSFRFAGATERHGLDIGCEGEEREVHKFSVRKASRCEDARLLYVALTRAKHRCVVYWGAFSGCGLSSLAWLLYDQVGDISQEGLKASADRVNKLKDDELLAELRPLVWPGHIHVEQVSGLLSHPYTPRETSQTVCRPRAYARPPNQPLDRWWRRTSYSAMIKDAHDEAHERDHDALAQTSVSGEGHSGGQTVRLNAFPKGAKAGTFLHELYEHLDFEESDPAAIEPQVVRRGNAHGVDVKRWSGPLTKAILEQLSAPLGGGLGAVSLSGVPTADRLNELDFLLPLAGGLSSDVGAGAYARQIAEIFSEERTEAVPETYSGQIARLPYRPLRGFLTGSIDLVFRAAGRWYLADYKSNHLGARRGDYGVPAMQEAMAEHHYFLQYHLYAVALERWLQWRMGTDYRPEEHFGGVYYLFLRGMGPSDSLGVFWDRPSEAMRSRLSALLDEGRLP